MPILEVAALLWNQQIHTVEEHPFGIGPSANSASLPILLVEGFEEDVSAIGKKAPPAKSGVFLPSFWNGNLWFEVLIKNEEENLPSSTCTLLDLRPHGQGNRGMLDMIGANFDLLEPTPLVVLVSSLEDFEGWGPVHSADCWQLKGHLTAEDARRAIKSFLQLCEAYAKFLSAPKPAAAKPHLDSWVVSPNRK